MEHLLEQPSDVCDLMPCKLDWSQLKSNAWVFWSIKHNDELDYQQSIKSINSYSVVPIFPTEKSSIQYIMEKISTSNISLVQFWATIKVNGSTFLSTADQPFGFYNELDQRLSSYRKLCLDTLIPIDNNEIPFGPPGRVFSRRLPEYNYDVRSYSSAEFPLLQTEIPLGIHSYYAFPVSNLLYHQCLGVFEIVSTQPSLHLPNLIQWLDFESVGLYFPNSLDILFGSLKPLVYDRLHELEMGLYKIHKMHSLPFAQIWIPYSQSGSSKVLYYVGASIYEYWRSMYHKFEDVSEACFIESGKALVGRAFASQGSCFCKDVTLLSINEYPVLPSAQKARFSQSFTICLQSKYPNNFVCVVEYFLPPNEMSDRDTNTFLNMLLSTMKEQFPGFMVASGNELGQRMLVEVVKVSPSDELDSFEIGQPLLSVQSHQDGGETTEIGQPLSIVQSVQDGGETTVCQQSNLQNGEDNVPAALLVTYCSSDKTLNCERTVEVDPLLPHPIEEAVTNRGKVNLDAAHDDHIEDTPETMQLDSHFEQPNLEINSAGNAITNNEKIHSHKNKAIQRIEKDHGITRKILEQHFGMTLEDAAKNLSVSRATLKRICREYEIARWPHHKTRKVNVHVSQGVSFQGAEPYVVDQQCPALSQEKGTDYLGHKISPATGKPCDKVMTLKVAYRGDIIKFQLPFSSTRVELEGEVEKTLKISLERFSIKYQDEDNDWILITTDSDLRDGMHSPAPASLDFSFLMLKLRIKSVIEKMSSPHICLVQFWAPIKVNGSTFLSTADQICAFNKSLSSYRRLCIDTLIPIDDYKEGLLGPLGRVFRRCLPEYNPDVRSYSAAEFPLLETAISLGIHSYYAFPVFNLHDQRYLGLFEIVSTQPSICLPKFIMGLNFKSFGLYSICKSRDMFFGLSELELDEIKNGLSEILERYSLPFVQFWIPFSRSGSLQLLYRAGASIYDHSSSMYHEFEYVSEFCLIESGKALMGRAIASQVSCFCKDVTTLSFKEYPLVPSARKARFTQSFAICLQSKCANNIVCVVEYFLPPNEMVVRDTKTFLNMLLSTMKKQLPGFVVAPGNELGQRMLVEVVKVSPSDELDSFEIGQPLLSVQSLQDGGETTEIDSFCRQSNLQKENNVAAALLVPSCSSDKRDSLNCEGTVEVDPSLPHPIEEAVTNRGTVNVDVAHDDHIEDTTEIMQLDSHFEQPNLETNSAGNATTNNEMIHSHKKNAIQRIQKDHGITRKILEQHYGMTLEDAAKDLHVSQATLKRICREHEIARWPNHKTRKVNVRVSQGVSFQGAEPYVGDQQCPATGKPCDSVMTLKVTYRGDIIKFQFPLSSTRLELEGEMEKRLKISLQRFEGWDAFTKIVGKDYYEIIEVSSFGDMVFVSSMLCCYMSLCSVIKWAFVKLRKSEGDARVIRAYAFWCFDDLLTSAGTWSSAEYARPVSKCGTAVKAVCVRKLSAEYFTNLKQGGCLYVWISIVGGVVSALAHLSNRRPGRGFTPLSKEEEMKLDCTASDTSEISGGESAYNDSNTGGG
ncbi:hypothetical protein KY289_009668 [Solanum tuberosum]|nr:hypothetical protein KY289_009668 [Solanum tuberosum]